MSKRFLLVMLLVLFVPMAVAQQGQSGAASRKAEKSGGVANAATAPPTRKDRWRAVYEDDDRTISFDTQTIVRSGRNVTVWERSRYTQLRKVATGPGYLNFDSYDETVVRSTYYCDSRQSSFDNAAWRNEAGEVVLSRQWETGQVERSNVMPDTLGEALYEAACDEQ